MSLTFVQDTTEHRSSFLVPRTTPLQSVRAPSNQAIVYRANGLHMYTVSQMFGHSAALEPNYFLDSLCSRARVGSIS
jgi:hypothetical protein